MSEHAAPTQHHSPAAATGGAGLASPEFDRQEIETFGKDDGHAVGVIGKMLVGFFFYSLLVMIAVAWWTLGRGGQTVPQPHEPAHNADEE